MFAVGTIGRLIGAALPFVARRSALSALSVSLTAYLALSRAT